MYSESTAGLSCPERLSRAWVERDCGGAPFYSTSSRGKGKGTKNGEKAKESEAAGTSRSGESVEIQTNNG